MVLKIALVGPQLAGKTTLANVVSGLTKEPDAEYVETVGVRILETGLSPYNDETGAPESGDEVPIELWDFSGSPQTTPVLAPTVSHLDGVCVILPATTQDLEGALRLWLSNTGSNPERTLLVVNGRTDEEVTKAEQSIGYYGGIIAGVRAVCIFGPENFRKVLCSFIEILEGSSKSTL